MISNQSLCTGFFPPPSPPQSFFFPFVSLPFILLWHCYCFISSNYQNCQSQMQQTEEQPHFLILNTFQFALSHTLQKNNFWSSVVPHELKACRLVYKQAPKNNATARKISQGGAQNPANHPGKAARLSFRECCSQRMNCSNTSRKFPLVCVLRLQKGTHHKLVSSSEQFWSKELFTICAVTSTEEHRKFLLHGQQELFVFLFGFFPG